jgi:hypothetical protein
VRQAWKLRGARGWLDVAGGHTRQVFVQKRCQLPRLDRLGQAGEAGNVGEERRHLPQFSGQASQALTTARKPLGEF